MIEFFRRMFAPERSSETAKERLKLVLLSDHLSLAPDVVAALKRDLLEVISRYVEIDPAHADVTFEQRDREVAMLASIPITGMRERAPAPGATATHPVTLPNAVPAHVDEAVADEGSITAVDVEPSAEPILASAEEPISEADVVPAVAPRVEHDAEPEPEPGTEPVAVPLLRREIAAESGDATPGSATPPARRRKRRRKVAAANAPRIAPHGTPGFDPA